MIQELLKNSNLLQEERKIAINGVFHPSHSSSTTTTTTATTTITTTTGVTGTTPSTSENQNLRCPRCDSSNTKFCYYNNYNLTQPRHFCKTCRRYWTKGGALRNVPIGGGCRKTKNTAVSAAVGKSTKMKSMSSEISRSGFVSGFDPNSHIFALMKANPNPNPNFVTEHVNARAMGFDPLHQLPSLGLSTTVWRNNQYQHQNGVVLGEVQSNGMQELYQKLKSSSNYYYSDNSPLVLSNVPPATSSAVLESAPVAGGELGYWNPTLAWSDLSTTNGAFP